VPPGESPNQAAAAAWRTIGVGATPASKQNGDACPHQSIRAGHYSPAVLTLASGYLHAALIVLRIRFPCSARSRLPDFFVRYPSGLSIRISTFPALRRHHLMRPVRARIDGCDAAPLPLARPKAIVGHAVMPGFARAAHHLRPSLARPCGDAGVRPRGGCGRGLGAIGKYFQTLAQRSLGESDRLCRPQAAGDRFTLRARRSALSSRLSMFMCASSSRAQKANCGSRMVGNNGHKRAPASPAGAHSSNRGALQPVQLPLL